ncbi:11259_t:CDS:10 [Ambispora leptoticha]|uniref:11259_t:CDS:1 n=1 Tax=Ambispora leptoticha TaxID=144679 RepID=A0A9N8YMK6_9GLOM|nr:11259_t:CDS:10 [Ambispora leptoticha]
MGIRSPSEGHVCSHVNGSVSPSGPSPSTSPTYQMPNGPFPVNERERRSRSSSESSVHSYTNYNYYSQAATSFNDGQTEQDYVSSSNNSCYNYNCNEHDNLNEHTKSRPPPPPLKITTNVGIPGSGLTRRAHMNAHKHDRKFRERTNRVSFHEKESSSQSAGSPPNEYVHSPSSTTPMNSGTSSPTQTSSSDFSQKSSTLTPNSPKTSNIIPNIPKSSIIINPRNSSLNYQHQHPSSSNNSSMSSLNSNSSNSSFVSNQMHSPLSYQSQSSSTSNNTEDKLSSTRPTVRKELLQTAHSYPSISKFFYDTERKFFDDTERNLQATLNHTNFCVIDVTGIIDPAEIKRKIFDALEIKDDRKNYNIHLTEIGPLIDDKQLVEKCKHADRIASLKLFVKRKDFPDTIHFHTAIEKNPVITRLPVSATSIEVSVHNTTGFCGGFDPTLGPELQKSPSQYFTAEPMTMPQPVIYQQQQPTHSPFSHQTYSENIDRQPPQQTLRHSPNKLQHPPNLTPGGLQGNQPSQVNSIAKIIAQQTSPLSSIGIHPYASPVLPPISEQSNNVPQLKKCQSVENIAQKNDKNFTRIQNDFPSQYNSVENFDQPPQIISQVSRTPPQNILDTRNFINNAADPQREHTIYNEGIHSNLTATSLNQSFSANNTTMVKPTEEDDEPQLWPIIEIKEEDKVGELWIKKPIKSNSNNTTLVSSLDDIQNTLDTRNNGEALDHTFNNVNINVNLVDNSIVKSTEEEEPPLWDIIDPALIKDEDKVGELWIKKPISRSSSNNNTLISNSEGTSLISSLSGEGEGLSDAPLKNSQNVNQEETPKDNLNSFKNNNNSSVRFDIPSSPLPDQRTNLGLVRSVSRRRGVKDSWVVRPTVVDVYEDLDVYFPGHDLDKEIDGTDNGMINNSNNDGEISPSIAAPITPTGKRKLTRGKSIRHVAEQIVNRERQQWAIITTAVLAETKLKRKVTKIWGNRTEQVKPGQSWSSQQGHSVDDNKNLEEKTLPKIQWVKGELIGKGTFGKVYLALNISNKEMIAVKQVERPTTASDMLSERQLSLVQSFYAEMNLLKVLEHEHIVQYLGYEETPEALNIFLEYVNGGSIGTCLKIHGRFKEPVVRSFTRQILLGLEYLHGTNIIHRDIKSDNILVTEDGCCKISDFGISKKGTHAVYDNQSNMSLQGTIFYLAPEVFTNTDGYSAKVDIWSLGCVVLEMFTGNRPWATFNDLTAMYKIGKEKKHPPIPSASEISGEAKDFLEQCFIIDPEARPKASELLLHPFAKEDPSFQFKKYIKVPPIVRSKQ